MKRYLAIDLGASSGRHIVGWREGGELLTEEVYRFANGAEDRDGHLIWDIERLEREVRAGIDEALARFPDLVSLSIDTWGVDYVLLRGNAPVLPCYAYRDSRTEAVIPEVHALVPFEELYARTGIQFQPFNTVYQLSADLRTGRLSGVTDVLLMPEYLMYRLTGVKVHEYTNATTGGLLNAFTRDYDRELIRKLRLPEELFGELKGPGTFVGMYKGLKVVLCPTHDTASAVESVPMNERSLFLSSGTWSLLGARIPSPITTPESLRANFTNEGGVGYIRYLKNIMGLWIIQNLARDIPLSFAEMAEAAAGSGYEKLFDVNKPRFSAPKDMKAEILDELRETELSDADLLNAVYRSLALCYAGAVRDLEALTGREYDTLIILGGGAKNDYLNRLTEQFTGKKTAVFPIEATAVGNLRSQMEADK